jgi:hypothetical protein
MSASPVLDLIAARRDLLTRQGSIVPTWRRVGGETYGPYYRLAYRDGRRQCSIYLGRDGPLVARARQALAALQNPLRRRRIDHRLHRHVRSAIRRNNARLNSLLRPLGLRLRGLQIRGWRTSPLRPWLAPRSSAPPYVSSHAPPTPPLWKPAPNLPFPTSSRPVLRTRSAIHRNNPASTPRVRVSPSVTAR